MASLVDPFQYYYWMQQSSTSGQFFGYDNGAFFDYGCMELPAVPLIDQQQEVTVGGLEPVVQTFYEGPERCECCINWIEKQPTQVPESEAEKYQRAAICVYRCKDHEREASRVGGLIALRYNRIVLQSNQLIDLVRPALEASGTKLPDKGHVEFSHPFKDLYFSYTALMKLSENYSEHSDELALLRLLEEVMKSLFSRLSAEVFQLRSKGTIKYDYLWTLFPRGVIVYKKLHGAESLLRVVRATPQYREECLSTTQNNTKKIKVELGLQIRCEFVAFDGSNFGVAWRTFYISKFEEELVITSLDTYPLGFHSDKNLRARCAQRGRTLLEFQSIAHCSYNGSAMKSMDYDEYAFVTGRVVVDAFRFNRMYPDYVHDVEPLGDDADDNEGQKHDDQQASDPMYESTPQAKQKLPWIDFDSERRPSLEEQQLNRTFFEARAHLLMLAHPFIKGFSLKYNQWFNLSISQLSPTIWMDDPLSTLVFDSDIKQMLTSFSRHHLTTPDSRSGSLAIKGQGLVVLLSGPSGTGKTLTAEVIAEETKRPLYRVMAGQLGSTPQKIEEKLEEVLEVAAEWNAVALVDEADTFIQKRESGDRAANEVVSIFLRRLEYFPGVIFLTTNMPDNIDTAFRSRCRLHIPYPALKADSRRKIWKLNFSKAGLRNRSESTGFLEPSQIHREADTEDDEGLNLILSDDELEDLTRWQLSGREIQNVVQNVTLWCKTEAIAVTRERLNTAIRMTVPYAKKDSEPTDEGDGSSDSENRPRKRPRLTTIA